MRFKNRYVLARLTWKDDRPAEGLNEPGLLKALRDSLEQQYGDVGLGSSLVSMQVKWYSPYSRLAVVRCDREACTEVCAAMRRITAIQLRRVAVEAAHVSGTLQACRRRAVQLDAAAVAAAASQLAPHHQHAAAVLSERLQALEL